MKSFLETTASVLALMLIAGVPSPAAAQSTTGAAAGAAAETPKAAAAATLGSVAIPRAVLADGKRLNAATYRIRLTDETAAPVAGQRASTERWAEFLQGGKVQGRALAIIVPAEDVQEVTTRAATPRVGQSRVETLRGDDRYVRIWFNHRGDQVLLYLPFAP